MLDPFIVLGLTSDASKEEIKEIYRQLSRKYHPDNNINNPDKEYSDGTGVYRTKKHGSTIGRSGRAYRFIPKAG